jgi:hypothetical protein
MADFIREGIIRTQAAKLGVSCSVHSEDHIFNFLINHPGFDSDIARVDLADLIAGWTPFDVEIRRFHQRSRIVAEFSEVIICRKV